LNNFDNVEKDNYSKERKFIQMNHIISDLNNHIIGLQNEIDDIVD